MIKSEEIKKVLQRGNVVYNGLVILISVRIRRQSLEILTYPPNWRLHQSNQSGSYILVLKKKLKVSEHSNDC